NPTESELKANECPEIASFTIQGPLFFGAADRFESALIHSINERPSVLILKMRYVPIIDATAEANLSALIKDFVNLGGTVLITELPKEPLKMLQKSGLSPLFCNILSGSLGSSVIKTVPPKLTKSLINADKFASAVASIIGTYLIFKINTEGRSLIE